ncbi:uncharacterized protein F4812DRAFT_444405 [Daldinia caldariorum]|uniref:uncharacterized protein n=1 Tax=Daldinia caldariorum TaxID=326644 RepID=UPI0020085984|nr:uncharacterized protein F4812DRAFT_444405 [Daldinia caldariorum]KAI1464073.1 hypothetical protein F4812DRAFT_444405 [Daldinia caldariorum]
MASQIFNGGEPLLRPQGPDGPPVIARRIDFSQSPLADHYSSYFAMVIDNLLTPDECAALLASAGSDWETLNIGDSWRECKRIRPVSPAWANALSKRLASYLPEEVKSLRKGDVLSESIAGQNLKANQGAKKTVWKLKGANERLTFLHYQPGDHFQPHCDSLYSPKTGGKSFLTCQIYLSDMPEEDQAGDASGGETRFWPSREGKRKKNRSKDQDGETEQEEKEDCFLDVKPKMGRALVFQQRMLWHSGQEVKRGEKFTVRLDLMYEHHFEKPTDVSSGV